MDAKSKPDWVMPVVRVLAHEAGGLLLICVAAAFAVVSIALVANARAPHMLPDLTVVLWAVAALGVLQIVCAFLIWRIFLVLRHRFAQRLQAATGGMDDRIFLADASGMPVSVLTDAGWEQAATGAWLDTIHSDDRGHWPMPDADGPQRVELRLKDTSGDWRWHRLRATPLHDARGSLREWVGTLHDIHEQKIASERRELVIGELRHRMKNLVTVIDALAKNSRRSAQAEPGVELFVQRFLGRLHALGTAGDLVLAGDRGSIEANALVRETLAPFMGENTQRIRVAGPSLRLTEATGAGLGLALHELATNALKYGALSVPEGRVSFTWSLAPNEEGQRIVFVWNESGGPPPAPPAKPGFGTRMIKSVAAHERDGRVEVDYPPDGLVCSISFVKSSSAAGQMTQAAE